MNLLRALTLIQAFKILLYQDSSLFFSFYFFSFFFPFSLFPFYFHPPFVFSFSYLVFAFPETGSFLEFLTCVLFFCHCQYDKGAHRTETCIVNRLEKLNNFLYNEANLGIFSVCSTPLITDLKLA